jgi:hypothetical protein
MSCSPNLTQFEAPIGIGPIRSRPGASDENPHTYDGKNFP